MKRFIKHIVITGGPQAGKTSFLSYIKKELEAKGFTVFSFSETATDLINTGFNPNIDGYDFQRILFSLQNKKEEIGLACTKNRLLDKKNINTKIVVFFDRSCIDIKAYIPEEIWKQILYYHNLNETQILNRYDVIIHLETVLTLKKSILENKTNPARYETNKSEAINIDKNLLEVYKRHKNIKIIGAYENVSEKYSKFTEIIEKELQIY